MASAAPLWRASAFLLFLVVRFSAAHNNIFYEQWNNIPGKELSDLTNNVSYPDNSTISSFLDGSYFEVTTATFNAVEKYGGRLTGYFLAPETGNYTLPN